MKRSLIIFALFSIIVSCQSNNYNVDISDINVNVKIKRFEKDLFELNLDSINTGILALQMKYGNFFELYSRQVLRIGTPNTPMFSENLKLFLTDYTIYKSYLEVIKIFPDLIDIKKSFTKAFSYYKYYFPDKFVPSIYTIITGFNHSIVVDENVLAIGLDKYLGRECEFYDRLMISNYLRINMHKDMIISDCMKAWALTEYEFNNSVDNLVNNMLYQGKIHYFQRMMLPEAPDTIIFGFTKKQMDWCISNEENIWKYLVENKLLYNNDFLTIKKFIEPSPFTKDFSASSPGRAVNWIGFRIVERYMNKNREVELENLMETNDYQEILQKAKYRP